MNIQKIIQQSIDLHVHVGPEIIPRKFTIPELAQYEKGKLKGIAVKNHFFPTVAMDSRTKISLQEPIIIHSLVLNHYTGGWNPDIIRASAELSPRPIIVWFSTLHTECFLSHTKYEIAEEWIDKTKRKKVSMKKAKDIPALTLFNKNGQFKQDVIDVLRTIKKYKAILATGHLSSKESEKLVSYAIKKIGIKKVIITHPIYQKIAMPIPAQIKLAKLGAYIEHCYSMYSIDNIPLDKIAEAIKLVGAKNSILSSDVGQTFSKSPSETLKDFVKALQKRKISEDEIKRMLIFNPSKLIAS
ncbi:MAG: hypothetical protein A3B90_03080 [Candidatus Magasanikbacteria bacterium RIFCSPHIGHO2_02_FULL_41_13]|uniref:Amidohydrolase-related domain-containing protein n=1 Tax=Candidatus Magasanikbacteria bacterium RIFCSPHIGHO2_02_FULL_41_13 TaxID=1798676 RepID=A0A1F6M715_9BACT|nr:MAG: hypothetical protein A3B90_03080 [Candidatus Magasanikbacteria bacterium RIFCSPHIGHO2_02_FULL_41_13]